MSRCWSKTRQKFPTRTTCNHKRSSVKKLLIIFTCLTVVGCSTTAKPYAELHVGYTFNQTNYRNVIDVAMPDGSTLRAIGTDYGNCDAAAMIRAGFEWESGARVTYTHDSNVDCGAPFNDRKEPHRDYFSFGWKFGGVK